MSGTDDLSNLFARVTALEKQEINEDQTVSTIIKVYPQFGLQVVVKAVLHQYMPCGDTQPLRPATCAADAFI